MSKQLTTVNTQAVVGTFSQAELDTLKQTIAKGTTNEQFALFVQTCANSRLNPFLNHIHCIVYNGKEGATMSLQIAVEGILYLARKTDGYKGIECQLIHENDEFKFDAKSKEVDHQIGFPRGNVIGGYAIAKREGFDDVVVLMESNEVDHMLKGRNGHMWRDWFNDMFKKHIMKRAAKLQYGIEIAEDETVSSGPSVDNIPEYKPQPRKDITPNQDVIDAPPQQPKQDDEAAKLKAARSEVSKKFKKLGIVKEDQTEYVEKHVPGFKGTLSDFIGLSQLLDLNIEAQEAQSADGDLLD
ncbi:RecT protein [Bacillus sp. MUM 116]|uniref:RecT family recombinase n=1 Tax=Bacillus sp. MUM 116 TaxID=1678002 RepID=UPI0008F57873|nr:RecT family recombinase [Bacillus sp. MUM 116]OIK13561.1 RecT protein [Bacillus sp. MUM 116]